MQQIQFIYSYPYTPLTSMNPEVTEASSWDWIELWIDGNLITTYPVIDEPYPFGFLLAEGFIKYIVEHGFNAELLPPIHQRRK